MANLVINNESAQAFISFFTQDYELRVKMANFVTMIQEKLEKELISQPELWRLALMPGAQSLEIALYPPVAREEIMWRNLEYSTNQAEQLKALEEAVYDNSLLLSDFRRVDCILDVPERIIVPAEVTTEDAEKLLIAQNPAMTNNREIMQFPLGEQEKLVLAPEADFIAFLKRTFYNVKFHSRQAILINYFSEHLKEFNDRCAVVLVRNKQLTLIAFEKEKLMAANDFKFETNTDAAYYVLASLQSIGFTPNEEEFDVAFYGQSLTDENSVAGILRKYVKNLKAVPFPTLRFRASKLTLQSPFPLLILPTCE
ncbi:MAG: DUF3822 family protein [Bacteroides sp.]|nr:DUF3822 family protein [Bacteroides sp.]MCM1478045.1 DUF3822 family protein [Bacteroides sp.]